MLKISVEGHKKSRCAEEQGKKINLSGEIRVIIKKAAAKDSRLIGACHYYCWQETYRGLINDRYLDSMDINKNMNRFEALFESIGQYQYILEENDKIIGFFDISKASSSYAPFEVGGLYLRKEYQGRGYGREIINFIYEKTDGKPFYLWCLESNPTSHFYIHMGGQIIDSKNEIFGEQAEKAVCFYFKEK